MSTLTPNRSAALSISGEPYLPFASPNAAPRTIADDDKRSRHTKAAPSYSLPGLSGLRSIYGTTNSILGFQETFSLAFCVFFGGALVGFCLARSFMMSPSNVEFKTVPGEWHWYSQRTFKPAIFIHIYCTILGGIFAVFQFIPAIRRRYVTLHRINGYLVIINLIPGNVAGSVVARRAFGGEINVQAAFYTLGIMIVFSLITGYINVKHTRKHRKWMLRAVTYTSVPITARLVMITARKIISHVGTYYSAWRCDEVAAALNRLTPDQAGLIYNKQYPQCASAGSDLGSMHVAVLAAVDDYPLGFASSVRVTFGMALWLATVIHVIGVEIYVCPVILRVAGPLLSLSPQIRVTDNANMYRRGFVLGRKTDEDDL
jgi:hypothetical protein